MFLSSSIVIAFFAASTMARNYTTSVEGAVVKGMANLIE